MMLRSTVTSVQGKCISRVNRNVVIRVMSLEKCFDCSTASSVSSEITNEINTYANIVATILAYISY